MPSGDSIRQERPRPARKKITVVTFEPRRTRRPSPSAELLSPPPPPRRSSLPSSPAAPPAPAPTLSKQARHTREVRAAVLWLRESWPDLFSKPPKPLAIGIGAEILTRAGAAGLKRYTVGTALRRWTQSPAYLRAIAAKGAVRWGLSGTAADFVASEHQAIARERLANLAAMRRTP